MSGLDFGGLDIGGTLIFGGFDSDGLIYNAEVGEIDTEYLSLIVERTGDGVRIIATDPRGTSEGHVYDGYTPVKGIDYFTPEEIVEMIETVKTQARATYIHNQMSASDTWVIEHNLEKKPSVTVVDSGDSVVVGDVTYINDNKISISFAAAFSGKAYLN